MPIGAAQIAELLAHDGVVKEGIANAPDDEPLVLPLAEIDFSGFPPGKPHLVHAWGFAAAFICTSIALTILGAADSNDASVLDRLGFDE